MAANAGQIKYITNGLLVLNKSIIPDFKTDDTDTRIYHIIYDWCVDNGAIPPEMCIRDSFNICGVERCQP